MASGGSLALHSRQVNRKAGKPAGKQNLFSDFNYVDFKCLI